MRIRGAAVCLLMVAAAPGGSSAQQVPHQVQPTADSAARLVDVGPCCLAERAAGGTIGALLLGVAGSYGLREVGYHLTRGDALCGDDACGLLGWVIGAVLGEAVGIGLGAHVGSGAHGSPLDPVAASLGVLLVAGMMQQYVDFPEGAVVVVPMVQIAAAVWAGLRE